MIGKNDLVSSYLTQYFYYKDTFEAKVKEIDDIWYMACGVHSPNMSGIHVTPENKGSKIVRVGEDKVKPLEKEKEYIELQMKNLEQKLHLKEIDNLDYELLEQIYRYKKTYTDISKTIGYCDKVYVHRKRLKIEKLIERYV